MNLSTYDKVLDSLMDSVLNLQRAVIKIFIVQIVLVLIVTILVLERLW